MHVSITSFIRIGLAITGVALVLCASPISTASSADPEPPEWRVRGQWIAHANADDVRAMVAEDDGALWAASASGGVAKWSPDRTSLRQYLAPQDGLPCNDIRDVTVWRGRVWFATCDGLAVHDPATDRIERVTASLPSRALTALVTDDAGRLWVGAEPIWDPIVRIPSKPDLGGWVGGGVASSDDGVRWEQHGLAEGLPSTHVSDLAVWRGGVYVATVPYPEWAPPTEDPDGRPVPGRWVASGGGLARNEAGRWLSWTNASVPELADDLRALAAGDDALWIGTSGRGPRRLRRIPLACAQRLWR